MHFKGKLVDEFDIDKIGGNPATMSGQMSIIKNSIKKLENAYGKVIEVDSIKSSLDETIEPDEIDVIIEKMVRNGDAFRPKRGFIRLM